MSDTGLEDHKDRIHIVKVDDLIKLTKLSIRTKATLLLAVPTIALTAEIVQANDLMPVKGPKGPDGIIVPPVAAASGPTGPVGQTAMPYTVTQPMNWVTEAELTLPAEESRRATFADIRTVMTPKKPIA